MKLILMTTPDFFVEEHQILTALFDEGLDLLHLRKPGTEPVFHERLLTLLPENYRKRIITHDHFYLKQEYKLRGIHLSQRTPDLPVNYKGHVSVTCRTSVEIAANKRKCDYVLLAPVFPDRGTALSEEAQLAVSSRGVVDRKVIAFGGVGLDNIELVRESGFGGAMVLGDVWNRFNIHSTADFKDLIMHFRRLKKACDK
ncbi:MAG: thiamine phosphate synthase [Prevotellaceae bacterium]|nr:thiamine phosphate synthase [Prevotellaceae bacterium]